MSYDHNMLSVDWIHPYFKDVRFVTGFITGFAAAGFIFVKLKNNF